MPSSWDAVCFDSSELGSSLEGAELTGIEAGHVPSLAVLLAFRLELGQEQGPGVATVATPSRALGDAPSASHASAPESSQDPVN